MSHKKARVPHSFIQAKIEAGVQDKIRHVLSKQALEYKKNLREKHKEYKIELQLKVAQICNLTHSLDDVQSNLIIAQNEAKTEAKKAEETEHKLRRTIQHLEQKVTEKCIEITELKNQTAAYVTAKVPMLEQETALLTALNVQQPQFIVPNWRDAWKWISTWCFVLITLFATVDIPPEVLAVLPENVRAYLIAFTAFCGAIGRLKNQSKGAQ